MLYLYMYVKLNLTACVSDIYLYSCVYVSAPPARVPCPCAEVFVVSAEPWVRPVGTSPASLLSLPRFHTHPILCTSSSPPVMGRWCVVNTAVEKLTHTCVRVVRPWEKGCACDCIEVGSKSLRPLFLSTWMGDFFAIDSWCYFLLLLFISGPV